MPDIGQKVTELLVEAGFTDIDSLLALAKAGDSTPLVDIHGIGERTAQTLMQELRRPEMKRRIRRLRKAGLQFAEKPQAPSGDFPQTFAGQTWCVTGSFESFSPRERAMEEVAKRGGKVGASVTSKTTHLLAGANPGSKLEKAHKLGTPIVTEPEFLAILQKP
jgi:DNA ligase (NAD+)